MLISTGRIAAKFKVQAMVSVKLFDNAISLKVMMMSDEDIAKSEYSRW